MGNKKLIVGTHASVPDRAGAAFWGLPSFSFIQLCSHIHATVRDRGGQSQSGTQPVPLCDSQYQVTVTLHILSTFHTDVQLYIDKTSSSTTSSLTHAFYDGQFQDSAWVVLASLTSHVSKHKGTSSTWNINNDDKNKEKDDSSE